jgi:hypothetical protein
VKRIVKGAVRHRPEPAGRSAQQRAADAYGAKLLAMKGGVADDVDL